MNRVDRTLALLAAAGLAYIAFRAVQAGLALGDGGFLIAGSAFVALSFGALRIARTTTPDRGLSKSRLVFAERSDLSPLSVAAAEAGDVPGSQ